MISVVLCTYNGENFIRDQLDSIINQSKLPDEILIFDDNSSDSTVLIIKEYINKYNFINWGLTIRKPNVGWRVNFFEGIKKAKGNIIFLADQDDIWHEKKLEIMSSILLANDSISVLTSNYNRLIEKNIKVSKSSNNIVKTKHNPMKVLRPGCTYCFKKEFFDSIKEFWDCSFPHDAFLYRFALLNNSLYNVDKSLINWRIHSDSTFKKELSQELTIDKYINDVNYLIKLFESYHKYMTAFKIETKYNIKKIISILYLRINTAKKFNLKNFIKLLFNWKYYPSIKCCLIDAIDLLKFRRSE